MSANNLLDRQPAAALVVLEFDAARHAVEVDAAQGVQQQLLPARVAVRKVAETPVRLLLLLLLPLSARAGRRLLGLFVAFVQLVDDSLDRLGRRPHRVVSVAVELRIRVAPLLVVLFLVLLRRLPITKIKYKRVCKS